MQILTENDKTNVIIHQGTRDNLQTVKESISAAINFYLCRVPFVPITENMAGNIYFLQKLANNVDFIPKDNALGAVICSIPNNEMELVQIWTETIDSTIQDIFAHLLNTRTDQNFLQTAQFLHGLRKSFFPSLHANRNFFLQPTAQRTNPTGSIVIKSGTEEELQVFKESISAAINFYLCRTPFVPITENMAGNIFFLQKLANNIQFILEDHHDLGNIICSIPNRDMELVKIWTESIDSTMEDILAQRLDYREGSGLVQITDFLNELRRPMAKSVESTSQS
nr:hypothetical protein [Cytophagales bacterium]